MPGEVQNQVISNLDVFSAVSLRFTCRHFKHTVSLPRRGSDHEISYLCAIECSSWHPMKDYFACYTCNQLKPKVNFTKAHTSGKRGKNGGYWDDRRCLSCLVESGALTSSNIVKTNDGTGSQAVCGACSTLTREWCKVCMWCRGCAAKGSVRRWRKGKYADSEGNARAVISQSNCMEHIWIRGDKPENPEP